MSLDGYAPKIAKRDTRAFGELYEKTRKLVFAVCLSVVKNRGVAEEITQDVFVAVWENAHAFRGRGYKTWILTIARNKSINALNRRKREVFVDFAEDESLGGSYKMDESADDKTVLSAALSQLGDEERQIVLLKNSGMKMKEIATLLQIPRGTASWKYAEAIKRLKHYLKEGA